MNNSLHGSRLKKRFHPLFQKIAELQNEDCDSAQGNGFIIQRIWGGANNALYKIETENGTLACKLCVDDGRQRAVREFGALSAIQAAKVDIAPRPVFIDESKVILPYPVVIYHWVEGCTLEVPLSSLQLENLLASYHCLHSIKSGAYPALKLTAWFHWFDFDAYLREIRELAACYAPWLAKQIPMGASLANRIESCIETCEAFIETSKVSPQKDSIPLRLTRVDPNPANAILGSDGHLRWVDWEYSGWGDPALDIAELRWHAALQPLGEEALHWLRINYKPSFMDPGFGARLRVWDHILAARWPLLILRALWSKHNGPDRERLSHVEVSSQQLLDRLYETIARAEIFFNRDDWYT